VTVSHASDHFFIACKQNNRFASVFSLFLVDVRLHTHLAELNDFVL
jgi:hypothetical protein